MAEAPTPAPTAAAPAKRSTRAASFLIGIGIFASRIVGLVRERVIATYFGTGLHADVLGAGLRMPNVLQNLLGEGTLSASFIPVYSELLGQGRARRGRDVRSAARRRRHDRAARHLARAAARRRVPAGIRGPAARADDRNRADTVSDDGRPRAVRVGARNSE